MDCGDSFGMNGWWLRPIPSVKDIAFTNKKFDRYNMQLIPDYF